MATSNTSPLSPPAIQEGHVEGSSDHVDGTGHHTGSSASRTSRSSGGGGRQGGSRGMHTSPHHSSHSSQGSHPHHTSPNRHGDGHPSSRHHKHLVASPTTVTKATTGSGRLERGGNIASTSWDNLASAVNGKEPTEEEASANYPTSAAEILPVLKEKIAILSGGRDRQGQSLVTFPAQAKTYVYEREDILKAVQYITSIPTEDVRDNGFSVVVDARNSTWQNTKLILQTLQEALPAQIHVVYIIQSGHFWQKKQTSRGHSKVKAKLEFSTIKLSSVEKLIRHVESSQLTSDLGGFLPYNHDNWIKLRLDLEHFISSFNALMEHTAHVEQQLRIEPDASDVEAIEDCLGRHVIMQDQLKKAPQNTIREGNELLRNLEQGRDEAGTSSMTPDKINAIAIIKRLLDNIGRRQVHLDDLWRERKIVLERTLQLKAFEKSLLKVKGWLKSRGEEVIGSRSDIGDTLEAAHAVNEQHEKFESKARQNHSSLTQLRRMADKMTGEHHFAAEGAQRQVAKLKSRFSRFESHLAERRAIVHASVKVHSMLNEWRTQSNLTSGALKQKVPPSTKQADSDQSHSNHSEQLSKLEQLASTIMLEASNLIELMKGAAQHAAESGRGRLDYSPGISHVKRLVEEVENHRSRVGQLAEAQKLHSEQFKQLHSCENDARQVTQWLHDMCQQMATSHGDIGDSLSTATRLIGELDKFKETAKKTYQYGCDLVSAAQRTRQSHSFDPHTSSSLLTELTSSWEKLTTAITESRERLLAAKEFHAMSEESLAKYSNWSTPIFELPKNAQLVKEKLIDMAEHKEELNKTMESCISAGSTLLDRLCRPLLPDASFRSLNDHTKRSLAFLRSRQEELERCLVELTTMVPKQEALFTEFITYCEFEQSIEAVLVWLQEYGLKQIQLFSRVREGQSAVKEQLADFDEFHETCKEYTTKVEKLHSQAPQVEAQIQGFKSELVKKSSSLKTVWDKFLQRVDNRRKILLLTSGFYDDTAKLHRALDEMAAVLSPETITRKGSAYIVELVPRKQLLDKLFEGAKKQGGSLLDLFRRSPVDQGDPSSVISTHLFNLEAEKCRVDDLWESGQKLVAQNVQLEGTQNSIKSPRLEPIGQVSNGNTPLTETPPTTNSNSHSPGNPMMSHVAHVTTGEEEGVQKVKVVRGQGSSETVSRKHADRYAELEEEAYKHLEWLEQECDTFLKSHTRFRESPDGASVMKTQHEQFLTKIDPTCERVGVVLESLQQLKPETLPLAPSIDQLCNVVTERVKGRRNTLKRRANTLKIYADFCSLYKEIDVNLQKLDDYLDKPLPKSVSMDTAQEILDQYRPLMDKVNESYKKAMSLGEEFLEVTSDMLSGRGGPKLSVGDACTSVAVDMGDLEGRYPDTKERWTARETELMQKIDWQSFKVTCDQLCSWLKDSAGMFLQSRVDVGTSLETAEDLLMEQQEFEIRAKRTAVEVQSLLTQSEKMLSSGHFASSELRDKAYDLRKLHSSFVSKLDTRRKTLSNSVQFYLTAQELEHDMDNAIEACSRSTPVDLSTNLKITSISTRLSNLQHTANKLLEIVGGRPIVTEVQSPKKPKQKTRRSDSASASELSIKQTLASLQKSFTHYKQAFEKRRVSPSSSQPSSGTTSPRPKLDLNGTSGAVSLRKTELKSPVRDKSTGGGAGEKTTDLSTKEGESKRLSSGKDRSREGTVVSPNISPYHRSRTYTDFLPGKKQTSAVNAVRKKVAALNQKADREAEQPITEFCTSFGVRPRAQTADSVLRTQESGSKRKSDSKTPTPSPARVSEGVEKKTEEPSSETSESTRNSLSSSQQKKTETTVTSVPESSTVQSTKVKGEDSGAIVEVETEELASKTTPPAASLSVPLRRKKTKGMSRSERSEKIAAIRALFESGDIAADLSLNTSPSHSASTGVKSASRPVSDSIKSASTGVKSASRPVSDSIKSASTVVKSASRPASESGKTDHERGPSPSVVISPPPDTRQRVYTAPTVYKTILKDFSPAKKRISVITVSPPPQESITPPLLEGVTESDNPPELEKGSQEMKPTVEIATEKKTEDKMADSSNLTLDTADSKRFARATRSASPQQLHRVDKNVESSKTSPSRTSGFKRPPPLNLSGKVSSLRSLFDSTVSGTSVVPIPRTRSDSKPVPVVEKGKMRRSSADYAVSVYGRQHEHLDTIQSKPTVSHDQIKESRDPSNESLNESHDLQEESHDDTHRIPSPDIIPKQPERPQLPNPADLSPPTVKRPPPRPPSPVGYYLDHEPDESDVELEFEIEFTSDSETSQLEEEDFDRKWTEEDIDGPTEAPDSATLVFKSLHTVLSDFLLSEMTYSQSVQTLVEVYLPSFSEEHIPTFLQGRKDSIFSNLTEIHQFQRKFYLDLSDHEDSLEGVCNTVLQHTPAMKCYVPFLVNMERGLQILSRYGGSYFEDKQREIGDEMNISGHYCRLKERWREYLSYFRELYVCPQKEYLHGVSLVKDALAAIHQTMTIIDNAITINKLRGCPYSLDANQVIRCELFSVYLTHGKKKPHLMLVCLHSNHVVFAHVKKDKSKETTVYEYRDSIEVASMHMLETYKSQLDKFALCEGRPTPDNLYVLQAVDENVLMKRIWMQEIRPLLQKNHNRDRLVGVEEMPLPLTFRTPIAGQAGTSSDADKEGWFSSLKRRGSFKRRNSIKRNRVGSLKRESKEESGKQERTIGNSGGTGLVLRREGSKFTKREKREIPIRLSAATSDTSSTTSSAVPVSGATVELASMSARGQFLPTERENEDLYVVIESFKDDREGFLSVERGQMVEALDDSGPIWMVLALPMAPGDLEAEGFIPGHILQPAGRARPSTMTGSHTSKTSNQWFEAETGQEIPSESSQTCSTGSGRHDDHPSITVETALDDIHSEETTGQNVTAPVVSIATKESIEDNVFQSSDEITGGPSSINPNETLVPPADFARTVSQPGDSIDPASLARPGLKFKFQGGPGLSSSIRSLPSSFSPTGTPRSPHTFLGYNPMMIPDVTLSQPELARKPSKPPPPTSAANGELQKLQNATVKEASMGSVDDFDPVEVYVAIADFEAAEESNISLSAGQCVQLLDSTRSDWWLVSDGGRDGWVPAAYLEQQTLEAPGSPPPEPFEDETGELQRIMMKDRTLSEINLTRQQLYKSSFLSNTEAGAEVPSEAQLQGLHGLPHPYIAVTEIQATSPGQLSLVQDQPVKVIDSKRGDWWLVSTIPLDDSISSAGREGWAPANQLVQSSYIREDSVENGVTMATSRGEVKVQRKTSHGQMGMTEPAISPSSPPMWVVLADYKATEPGMLSVHEGELVEVLDISRNDWCLVRPASRQSMEGWVPTAFLKPYNNSIEYSHPSMLPTLFRSRPSPDDSDTPTEVSDRESNFSPELLEPLDNEEKRIDAKERRRFCLSELISSEQEYVGKLQYCIENYIPAVDEDHAPKPLKVLKGTLFGNLEEIYTFHKEHFLPKLLECELDPTKLGDVFVSSSSQLQMYVTYCQNKAASDDMYQDYAPFFEEVRMQLGDRLKLPDFLILPVQRITKYNLLLQDFNKYSVRSGLEGGNIDAAIEVTKGISTQANNTIHLSLMEGVDNKELGELALQDLFLFQESQRQVLKERRVFLFRKALIITKKRRESSEKETYVTKEKLMLTDISMTQDMDTNKQSIIIYEMLSGTKFILKAFKTSTRDNWLTTANELIRTAKRESVNNLTVRGRSSTDPLEYILRSPSLGRKFKRDREGSARRRSMKRPHSSSGPRESVTVIEDHPPAGTEYVVMECIVMEGSDDTTLDPGEIVELVRVEPTTGALRVKTQDDNHLEGVVPASYLRRRDLVKAGARMESTPKLTMKPVDMDLLTGTTATISCAFNGYPLPSVVWRKDFEILTSDSRRKITSCATSSVLEVILLEFDDEGTYSCYVTNSMGSDSAEIYLSIHGPPSQPPKPAVSKITSSSVKLKWAVPELDGGSPILSYQIELLQEGFDQWQPIVQHPRNYFVVKTLDPQTSYQFRVIAYNEYGASKPSEPTKVVGTKSKGWLTSSPSFKKPPMITIDGPTDNPDAPFDQLGVELTSPLSPKHDFIRRGSLSVLYDVMPEELGRGRFGIVHKCLHKQNGLEYAAKYVRLRSKRKVDIRREVDILQKVRGKTPHIAELQDAFERGRNLIIVTELVPDGELVERIIGNDDLTEGIAVGYISQLLSAVECLHQLNIAHLDIRPENILLYGMESPTLKLIDFGAAREVSMVTTPVYTSSIEFCAPEIITQAMPTLASDMWSIGVLTYVILSGISPFFVDNIQVVVERIKEARYNFYNDQFDHISQEAKDFIAALLQKSPEYRMSVSEALQHQWIRTLSRSRDGGTSPWPMARLDISRLKTFNARRKWHTMSVAIDDTTVFGPRSMLCLSPVPPDFEELAKHEAHPRLWDGPTHMRAPIGTSATFSFQVSGQPEPTVIWEHGNEELVTTPQFEVKTDGGVTSLCITEVEREDEGMYTCLALNSLGSATMECHLTVLDVPGPPSQVNSVILGYNSTLISWLPPTTDGNCLITSYILEKRRLEVEIWEGVASDIDSTAHVVEELIPGATYIFRVFAVNEVGVSAPSKPSRLVTMVKDRDYDSDSPSPAEVTLKITPVEFEYEIDEELFRGSYSVVNKCRERTTDRLFVAKTISADEKDRAFQEFDILRQLSHPRLVILEDAFMNNDQTVLVMEYLPGGSLEEYLLSHGPLSEQLASLYTRKIMEGLQYLHSTKIIHTNIAPNNLLLTIGCKDIKICDFGMARYIEACNQLQELRGDIDFMAPEAVSLQPLTTAADIWSTGAIVYWMVTAVSPFAANTRESTIENIRALNLDKTSDTFTMLSHDCQDFILDCTLIKNPRRRLTAEQTQRHRWLHKATTSQRRPSNDPPLPRMGSERRHSSHYKRRSCDSYSHSQ